MITPVPLDKIDDDNSYLKIFGVSEAKIGKTTFFACSALGALPEQKFGLISDPTCMHILGFDEGAVEGLKKFIVDACKRPDCLKMNIWPMWDICRTAILGNGYDSSIQNNILAVLSDINKRCGAAPDKVHCVLFSSFTGMGMALKHGIAGKPTPDSSGQIKSSGMNQAKWDILNASLMAIRAEAHRNNKHVIWEGHVQTKYVAPDADGTVKPGTTEETVGVPGGEGRNWGANVKEITRIVREAISYKDTNGKSLGIDKVYMNTRPTGDFISGGRGFNDLDAKEYDIALMCKKLGKRVGGYTKP